MKVSRRIVLHFPPLVTGQPVVYRLARDYDLMFNILRASVSPGQEGLLVLELTGERANYDRGIQFLRDTGIQIQPLSQDVTRDESRCTHCGACVAVCPTGALYIDKKTMKVIFDSDKCIACELCVKACPPRAMLVKF